jgi:hypothetical protein
VRIKSLIEVMFGLYEGWHFLASCTGISLLIGSNLPNVSAEMDLNVLAYNFKRVLSILGFEGMMRAMRLAGV